MKDRTVTFGRTIREGRFASGKVHVLADPQNNKSECMKTIQRLEKLHLTYDQYQEIPEGQKCRNCEQPPTKTTWA